MESNKNSVDNTHYWENHWELSNPFGDGLAVTGRTPKPGEVVIAKAWCESENSTLMEELCTQTDELKAELALLRRVAEAAEKALYRGKPETTALDDLEFDENGDPTDLFNALAAWKASRTP